MASKKVSLIFYGLAGVALLLYLYFLIREQHDIGGWFGVLFFVSLSIAFRGNKFLKGLSFTVIIFAAVVM
ncbi:MAG TPA: bile acid:sodium symporter family protein, partial [Chitinophagaceae bacterium]|nr:bile acid:sodium symporter family protein [Chitinophagaceae bacterium]